MTNFAKWIDTFLDEKNIDLGHTFQIETPGQFWNTHLIPVECVVEAAKNVSPDEQLVIKHMLVRLDFYNQPVLPYLEHLATALVGALNDMGQSARASLN